MGLSILIILILLPYVAVVFRTGNMNGLAAENRAPDIEDYVAGILPGQIPMTYEEEALKAQAVIARTNLLQKSINFYQTKDPVQVVAMVQEKDLEEIGFEYYTPAELQELWGYEQWEQYEKKIRKAVEATAGEFLALEGKPIDLPYHAVSAGKTRDGKVLGETYSYLESVECAGDLKSVDYLKVQTYSPEEFHAKVLLEETASRKAGEMEEGLLEITARDQAGYVTELRMGEQFLAGEEFRSRLGLNSSYFTIEETEEGVRITTKGLGHGLGLSLYQANLQALDGKTYLEILLYFYKNVECISFSQSGYAMVSNTGGV